MPHCQASVVHSGGVCPLLHALGVLLTGATFSPKLTKSMKSAFPFASLLLFSCLPSHGIDILTQHGDNGRSGLNASETVLTTAGVNSSSFGKLFEKAVDGDIYSQPLYVQGLTIGGGTHNVVFVATAKNNLYAFDADNGSAAPYWTRTFGAPVPEADVQCCCDNIQNFIGIIGTGVIDRTAGVWYMVSKEKASDGTIHQYLHAVNLTDGSSHITGTEIAASAGGVSFNASLNNQRASLLLQAGNLYIAWSSHGDCGAYHGWVIGYNASTFAQAGVFPVTNSSGSQGGVWMAGGGPVGDGSRFWFSTGNGSFNANTGGTNYSECYVKLDNTCVVKDYFAPASVTSLNNSDRDLGSSGVMMIPGTTLMVGGGKDGKLYLVDGYAMGGFNASVDACRQSFMVTDSGDSLNHIHGGPCFWNNKIYLGGESDQLKAFSWNGTSINTTPVSQSSFEAVTNSMPGWQLFISANGSSNGIVWATRTYSGDATSSHQPGILHAFDGNNLGTELWNSKQNAGRDDLGNFAKNPSVIVANGKVYCPTFSNKLVVYGLLGNTGTRYETESLAVLAKSSDVHDVISDGNMSNGEGTILRADAAADFVTYTIPNIAAGNYNVKVGVKKLNTRGQFQLAVSRTDTNSYVNVGAVQDEFDPGTGGVYTEFNVGTFSPATTSDKAFRFTVTGKNASSTGFTICFDYITLTPQ